MSVDTDPQFARIVSEKMDQAIVSGRANSSSSSKIAGTVQAVLLHPDTGQIHRLTRQPLSHIVETPSTVTKLDESVQISAEPQRVLIEANGLISLLMKREAIPIRPEGVAETKKSVSGAEPISEAELNRHAGYDIREVLNRRDGDHLQARVQALLRSGMFSSRYVIVCQSICLRDDALVERRVARAIFASEVGESRGAIVNAIHERSLSQDSIDMTMNFSSGQSLFVGGEQVVTNVLDVNIVGNDVVSLEQKSRLDPCSVQFVSDIVDNASLIPLRDV